MKEENTSFFNGSSGGYLPWISALFLVVVSVILLKLLGRVWWCQAGDYSPWSWDVWSTHNSQHLIDPYSFTHVMHGILFYWIASLIFPKLSLAWRLVIALSVECTWEVVENTDTVINRYREATISLDYFGDSILNSFADILSFAGGFWLAYRLRFWLSLIFFLLMETILLIWIRDSLILNIIMLVYPLEAIKKWQMGG